MLYQEKSGPSVKNSDFVSFLVSNAETGKLRSWRHGVIRRSDTFASLRAHVVYKFFTCLFVGVSDSKF
jgi:hypothetical protein